MKINLNSVEIGNALLNYVASQGIDIDEKDITITFNPSEGAEHDDYSASIDISTGAILPAGVVSTSKQGAPVKQRKKRGPNKPKEAKDPAKVDLTQPPPSLASVSNSNNSAETPIIEDDAVDQQVNPVMGQDDKTDPTDVSLAAQPTKGHSLFVT